MKARTPKPAAPLRRPSPKRSSTPRTRNTKNEAIVQHEEKTEESDPLPLSTAAAPTVASEKEEAEEERDFDNTDSNVELLSSQPPQQVKPSAVHTQDLEQTTLSPKNRDELASYQLRFSFQGVNFGEYYRDLCNAGWKFVGQLKYRPPDVPAKDIIDGNNDQQLLTANEIAEHLDYFSLANDLYSNLQHPTTVTRKKATPRLVIGQEARWRKLREDAVYQFFLSRVGKGGEDSEDDDYNNKENGNGKKSEKSRKIPSTKASLQRRNRSVTTADAGADLFFNKGARKARQSRRTKQVLANQKAARQAKVVLSDEQHEQLPFERLSLEQCAEQVKGFDLDNVEEYEATYREQFQEWRFLLSTNHSLLLYGYGSKYNLLNDFVEQELSEEGYAVVLNGFDPDISAESIMKLLVDVFLDANEPAPLSYSLPGYEDEDVATVTTTKKDTKSGKWKEVTMRKIRDPIERAKAIGRALARTQAKELYPIFLVIHNLEGMGLRNRLSQEILATLVANSKVKHCGVHAMRLVASVDHVDAPAMLWNVSTTAMFSWIWREVHTYRPYVQELFMLAKDEINTGNSKKRRSSTGGATQRQQALVMDGERADRVLEVLRNLANRYTEVMQILATLQLEAQESSPTNQSIHWIDQAQLLQQCLNKCTVKNDTQLRTFLNELEDHELVMVQKQGSTTVLVRIPYPEEKLHEILSFRATGS